MRLVNLLQTFLHDVGINLRRGNIAMTKHQLDGAEIGAAFQKMGGKTVTKHVGCERHTQTGLASVRRENFPDADAAKASATTVQEKNGRVGHLPLAKKLWAGIAKIAIDEIQ